MSIEPEVIPIDSDEGETAKAIYPIWINISFIIIIFSLFVLILRTLLTASLITIGLYFIWQKATKLIKSE